MNPKRILGWLLSGGIFAVLGMGIFGYRAYADSGTGYAIAVSSVSVWESEPEIETAAANDSASPWRALERYWGEAKTKIGRNERKILDWYHANNTGVQIIPDLMRVRKIDFVVTILGIFLASWLALKFFFFRH